MVWIHYTLFIQLFGDGHLSSFQLTAIANKTAMNIFVQIFERT